MKRSWQLLVCMVLAGLTFSSLTGSRAGAQDAIGNGLEKVDLSGKLEMIVGNQIKFKAEDGQESVVLVGEDTTFSYIGTAEPAALTPGLMVRFTAPFDAAGTPQAPLAELEIFRPARERRMSLEMRQSQTPGIYPAIEKDKVEPTSGKGAASNKPATKTTPAAKPGTVNAARETAAKGNSAKEDTTKGRNAKANRAEPVQSAGGVQDYLVVGMLRAVQGDKLQIFAGNRPVIVQAEAGVKINVSAGDPLFCQPGDEIKLTGLKSPEGLIQAEAIEVTGAKPLGSVDEKAHARNSRTKQSGKSDEKQTTDKQGNSKVNPKGPAPNKAK